MSVECSVCEWDARAGHAPDCKFNPIHELRAENERLKKTIAEWQQIHGTFTGDVHHACQVENERLRAAQDQALTRLRTAWAELKASWSQGDSEEAYALMGIDMLLGVNDQGKLFGEPTLWQS